MGFDDVVVLTIREIVFWSAAVIGLIGVLVAIRSRTSQHSDTPGLLDEMKTQIGLPGLESSLFLIGALMWCAIFLVLFVGEVSLIIDVVWGGLAANETVGAWRFLLAQLAATTAVFGVVVAFPVTLRRLYLQKEADDTAKRNLATAQDSLFNEKINAATEDLYSRRQSWRCFEGDKDSEGQLVWEDDVTRRNAGIDRLFGLVVENPSAAERVSRLLSVYVRELSAEGELPPEEMPRLSLTLKEKSDEFGKWALGLQPRSDIQNAVQTLGRLRQIEGVETQHVTIDLRNANLQGVNFDGGRFEFALLNKAHLHAANLTAAKFVQADFSDAKLQKAVLVEAEMQNATFIAAKMQFAILRHAGLLGADLRAANLSNADLSDAQLGKADLTAAKLIGANLNDAQLQSTELAVANLAGANLAGASFAGFTTAETVTPNFKGALIQNMDSETVEALKDHWQDVFADGSIQLPEGEERPGHWATDIYAYDEWLELHMKWEDWQRSIGQDPDNPE